MSEILPIYNVDEVKRVTGPTKYMQEAGIEPDRPYPYTQVDMTLQEWPGFIIRHTPIECDLSRGDKVEVQDVINDENSTIRQWWDTPACNQCKLKGCGLGQPPREGEKILPFDLGCAGGE